MPRLAGSHEQALSAPPSSHEDAMESGTVPVDKFGMPFLLLPREPFIRPGVFWDDDHSFFFSSAPELTEDLAGRALRLSRVQYVDRATHNKKHNVFFTKGVSELPQTEKEKFALTVLAAAGYASRTAIDLSGSKPKLVRMNNFMYRFVKNRNQLHPEQSSSGSDRYALTTMGMFFASYLRKQNLIELVGDNIVDEFLNSANEHERRKKGNFIIRQAIINATDPIEPLYQKALRRDMLSARPKSSRGVVATIFPVTRWPDYHGELEKKILAA